MSNFSLVSLLKFLEFLVSLSLTLFAILYCFVSEGVVIC